MTKKIKTLIAAASVLLLLLGGYYASIRSQTKTAELPAGGDFSPPLRLGNLDASRLVRIEVPEFTLEKEDEHWKLVSVTGALPPAGIELDQNAIYYYAYSLAGVWAERVIEEVPPDISIYGLEHPSARISASDSAGEQAVYLVGDMTPSRNAYYVMQEGDTRVYTVSAYTAENMMFDLGDIREKTLFPVFEINDLIRFRRESSETVIDITLKPDTLPAHMAALYSAYIAHTIVSPYERERGVDAEAFQKIIEPLSGLRIDAFAEDNPVSIVPYGLDKPVHLYLETAKGKVDLLIGNPVNGMHYVKHADNPGVFIVGGLSALVDAKPFDLADKFAFLVTIDNVDSVSVTGGEIPLHAELQKNGDEAVYFLNGKKVETKSFRAWYQTVIGLIADAEYPGPAGNPPADAGEEITIAYELNSPAGTRSSFTLIPYGRDYYALRQEGVTEFLISRNQVRKIFQSADTVVFEE